MSKPTAVFVETFDFSACVRRARRIVACTGWPLRPARRLARASRQGGIVRLVSRRDVVTALARQMCQAT